MTAVYLFLRSGNIWFFSLSSISSSLQLAGCLAPDIPREVARAVSPSDNDPDDPETLYDVDQAQTQALLVPDVAVQELDLDISLKSLPSNITLQEFIHKPE